MFHRKLCYFYLPKALLQAGKMLERSRLDLITCKKILAKCEESYFWSVGNRDYRLSINESLFLNLGIKSSRISRET